MSGEGGTLVINEARPPETTDLQAEEPATSPFLVGPDSTARPLVSVVIPTLNEEAGIGHCIDSVIDAFEELHLPGEIIVSDSSTDRTPDIARERGAHVVEPDAPGYGYAYRYAFEHVRGDYVVIGDADTTYDFTEIPRLLEHMVRSDADIVMGSRLEGEIKDGAMPALHQYIGNPLLTRFLNAFYDAGVTDAHSGFRLMRREVLDELQLESAGMEFASEMVMEAAARELTIEEVPITYHEREGEATLDSFRDGWRHVKFMLVNAPNYIFSAPGAVCLVVGLAMLGVSYPSPEVWGFPLGIHTMFAGSMLTLLGSQVWSLGLFSTVTNDPVKLPNDPVTVWISEHIQLDHGVVLGSTVTIVGGILALGVGLQWAVIGYTEPYVLKGYILSLTVVVFGLQVIFQSAFLSLARNDTAS